MSELDRLYNAYAVDVAFAHLREDGNPLVRGEGSLIPKLVLVGEAPGAVEARLGRPFVGPSGKVLGKLLAHAGLNRKIVFITNIVKYRPPANRNPTPYEVSASVPYLRSELVALGCRNIALLGNHALSAVFPGNAISRVRGTTIEQSGWYFHPMYHPAVALYNQTASVLKTMEDDFTRLKEYL